MINTRKSEYSYAISSGGNDTYSSDSSSDENILHVVTNVYTIPLQKTCTDQSSIDQLESNLCKKMNEIKINLSKPADEETKSSRVEHKSFDTNTYSILSDNKTSSNESQMTKSKFQIKSIVEIYESQNDSEAHQGTTGHFKSSDKFYHTISENKIPINVIKGKLIPFPFTLQITLLLMHHSLSNLLDTKPTKILKALLLFNLAKFTF